jgi:hypothetical protein
MLLATLVFMGAAGLLENLLWHSSCVCVGNVITGHYSLLEGDEFQNFLDRLVCN